MPDRMLVFRSETGVTTLVRLPLSTLTLLSAVMFSADTAVVIGAVTLPIRPPMPRPLAAKAGEAISRAREVVTIYFMGILQVRSSKPFARHRYYDFCFITCNLHRILTIRLTVNQDIKLFDTHSGIYDPIQR